MSTSSLFEIPIGEQASQEAALRIQVEKCIAVEHASNHFKKLEDDIRGLREFTLEFALKLTAGHLDLADVSSMVDEVSCRVEEVWNTFKPPISKIDHQTEIAKLQGTKFQLVEKNNKLKIARHEKPSHDLHHIKNETNVAALRRDILNLVASNELLQPSRSLRDIAEDPNFTDPFLKKIDETLFDSAPGLGGLGGPMAPVSAYRGDDVLSTVVEDVHPTTVIEPNKHDVLSGKGYKVIFQKGNEYFRALVKVLRHEYVATPRADKKHFAKLVHAHIRSLDPPGRFLKRASDDEPYIDIGVTNAINKTSQALREGKPQIDKKIKSGEIVVKKVGKSEVAALIAERSRQIYKDVFPEFSEDSNIGTEPFLPGISSSREIRSSKEESFGEEEDCYQRRRPGTIMKERPSLSAFQTNSFADFSQKIRQTSSKGFQAGISSKSMMTDTDLQSNGRNEFRRNLIKMKSQSCPSDIHIRKPDEYAWRTRNSEFLEIMEEEGKKLKRRRSSADHELKHIHTMQAFDETENDVIEGSECLDILDSIDIERMSLDSIANSLADVSLDPRKARRKSSVRFSLVNRRSARMSLILRQSCTTSSIFSDLDDEDDFEQGTKHEHTHTHTLPQRRSYYIPDVFASQRNKRRSSIIESTSDLLNSVYGESAKEKLINPRRRSALLNSILEPDTKDILAGIHSSY